MRTQLMRHITPWIAKGSVTTSVGLPRAPIPTASGRRSSRTSYLLGVALVDLVELEVDLRVDALEAVAEVDADDQDLDDLDGLDPVPCRAEHRAAHERHRFDRTGSALPATHRGGGIAVGIKHGEQLGVILRVADRARVVLDRKGSCRRREA